MNRPYIIRVVVGLLGLVLLAGCSVSRPTGESTVDQYQIRYQLKQAGQVSLAVYETASGTMVRTLLSGEPQAAGAHTLVWDGRDQLGQPLPAGTYTWRLLATPGFTAR